MAEQVPDKMRALVLSEYRENVHEAIAGLEVQQQPARPGARENRRLAMQPVGFASFAR
jgi:hypothetical protein